MASRYNTRLIKVKASYTMNEVAQLFGIDRRTCDRWIKEGLKVMEKNTKPLLIMGGELRKFLDEKQKSRKVKLKEEEYFCVKCQRAVLPRSESEELVKTGKTLGKDKLDQILKKAICRICGTSVNKFLQVCQKVLNGY